MLGRKNGLDIVSESHLHVAMFSQKCLHGDSIISQASSPFSPRERAGGTPSPSNSALQFVKSAGSGKPGA